MAKIPKRECACGCGRKFTPKVAWQLYVNRKHKNRVGQRKVRQKAREHGELSAALNGGIGSS